MVTKARKEKSYFCDSTQILLFPSFFYFIFTTYAANFKLNRAASARVDNVSLQLALFATRVFIFTCVISVLSLDKLHTK